MPTEKFSGITASGTNLTNATDVLMGVRSGTTDLTWTPLQASAYFWASPTITGHATIEGVTATGATGTGNFVFSAAPTITGHPTIEGVTSTGATGTGKFVFDGTPTLVTPVLGVATATSLNKVALTAPATSATLTIADGKTLTVSNSITLVGTDSTTMTFPTVSSAIGFLNVPQNSQNAGYTTVLTDSGKHILMATAGTFTIDSNANVAYPLGTVLTFINGTTSCTIPITSDTMTLAGTATTGTRTLAANGIATAIKIGTTSWIISGTGLT